MTGFDETEPTDLQKFLVDEALYLRGRIVAAYAQVEFLLADLVVKLDLRFPYLIDKRIKAVRQIADRPGYSDYKLELDAVCEELYRYDALRHFMAHGFMSMDMDRQGNHRFELLRYEREAEGQFTLLRATIDIERLRQAVADIGEYVSHVMRLFERIYREKKLEPKPPTGDATKP
jgi:hypothetical protein